jgi:hypothetical protein
MSGAKVKPLMLNFKGNKMKYRVLKKGNEHAIQIKKWYGWANYLAYSHTTSGPGWLLPNHWYGLPPEVLIKQMKINFRGQPKVQVVQVVEEGEVE